MRRTIVFLVLAALIVAAPQVALAQADARQAFGAGKAAFAKGQFEKARELLLSASQTDSRNPEVFLWLGKAHYQLGDLDKAIAAWQRTIQLAPQEPYAAKMLKALRRELTEVKTRIALIEVMLKEKLFSTALSQCHVLLAEKALSDAQRAKVMTLQATGLLGLGKAPDVIKTVQELLLRHPTRADAAKTTLLLGQAKVRTGGLAVAEGLTLLKKVLADHAGTPAAATAEYELLIFGLNQKIDAAGAAALSKWIGANAAHASVQDARKRLVGVYVELSRRSPAPRPDAKLSAFDASAIAVAADLLKQSVSRQDAVDMEKLILTHLDSHYAARHAYSAAIAGAEAFPKAQLPPSVRLGVLRALARNRAAMAIKQLSDLARAGKPLGPPGGLAAGAMPKVLADAVAAYAAINREFPARAIAEATWQMQATLAGQVRDLGKYVPWPARVTAPKGPYNWAVQIALPVIQADAAPLVTAEAFKVIEAIVTECAKFTRPPARGMALAFQARLLSALRPDNSAWIKAMLKQIDLLDAYAAGVFADNIKAGRGADNAKLTDHQKQLLAAMAKLVGRHADQAAVVLKRLGTHLRRWVQHGHYELAEGACTQLAAALPPAQKRAAALAVAELFIRRAAERHNMLLAAGLTVARKLDPLHAKALERCYALQAGLDEDHAFLARVRKVWDGIIRHYINLEYWDIAEEAIKTRPAAAVDAADAYAQLALAGFHRDQARRELDELLTQYGAAEKISLTDAFKTAIADYTKFISDRPESPLVAQAVGGMFNIARIFQQHQAYDVAAGVYRDFAAFAAKLNVLSQAAAGAVSTAERAECAVANALYHKAVRALAKAAAAREPQGPPPEKISDEFAAAIAAYKDFIKARPRSALLAHAIGRIMSVALEYVRVGSWDVAEGIYADLLASELATRRPERIEFSRGLCHLGKVMPEHAKKVLTALSSEGPKSSGRGEGEPGGRMPEGAPTTRPARPPAAEKPIDAPLVVYDFDDKELNDADELLKKTDMLAMATIRKHHQSRASRIAMLRDKARLTYSQGGAQQRKQQATQPSRQLSVPSPAVLSDAEIARQEEAFAAAYGVFQQIRGNYARTATAAQARGEIMSMIVHWRSIARWQRAARLTEKYLADNPTDMELPKLRLSIARDYLAWAAKPVKKQQSTQAMLTEVASRFDKARALLGGIVKALAKEKSIIHGAQWDMAGSFLTQARVVGAFSPTLARGQFVRAAKELLEVAAKFHDHPNIGQIPQMLWGISQELTGKAYHDEAITVWNDLTVHYPTHSLGRQAAYHIAETYQKVLDLPLRAVEAYMELNFARGGNDRAVQDAILRIGSDLKSKKRWVEALHVLETFVDSFPRHPSTGQALTMVGQIHQANEAWEDAIAAYQRVINEFPSGAWTRTAKWSIAECTINLSRWREAMEAYRSYLSAYPPKDPNTAEANRRIGILKDLARYQSLVDEKGQRKAFDAQYQIAEIVLTKLSNPVKAIIEYKKVVANWPDRHLADDAMFKMGQTYLSMVETNKSRKALLAVAGKYPNSPLADDALYLVGQSYENEAQQLAVVTRAGTVKRAQEKAQKQAYSRHQVGRAERRKMNISRIQALKKGGKYKQAEMEEARGAAQQSQYDIANVALFAEQAGQEVQALTAKQLADRQDKINAALRKAVGAYLDASKVAAADKADESLLRMAVIYADRLKDSDAAMKTYMEIVRQFSGTAVAEDASWRIAQYYEREGKFAEAIDAYKAFVRSYRRSARAGPAQFAVAESYEHLSKWVDAMDAYKNYITNFPKGPLVQKAKEQINWIEKYRL